MSRGDDAPPLIVIVGPTASGKSGLALKLARQYGGEIVAADSRTIYRDMTIGTAKPTADERTAVPHWGLDLVSPGERFTAADFQDYATQKIAEIRDRRRIPFLVGGTGLYVDAVLFDYSFGGPADPQLRQQLETLSLEELHDYCLKHNISLPENQPNRRAITRAIERNNVSVMRRNQPIDNSFVVGIATNRQALRPTIRQRIEHMFDNGVVEEARMLGKKYGWESQAMTGNIYNLLRPADGTPEKRGELVEKATQVDWRLAKRQMTWLQRNPFILWDTPARLTEHIARHLES